MKFPESKRLRQFSLRAVFAIVALIAILMLPISHYYRAVLDRPNSFATATLMIGSGEAQPPQYVVQLDAASLCQLMLDEPHIQAMSPIRKSRDPKRWLRDHLTVRAFDNTSLVEIIAHGRSEHLSARDLQMLLDVTIDVIRTDAMKTNTPVTVVSTMNAKLSS